MREIPNKHSNIATNSVQYLKNNFECIWTITMLILKELLKPLNYLTCLPTN